jgi:hypothetical protein
MNIALRSLTLIALLLVLAPAFISLSAQPDSQLPDGKQFEFWEKPFTASRTYYVNGATGSDENAGTQERPFKTINKAAQVLQPGERVIIAEGVYRERVDPARGGSGPDKLISYEAAPGANVVISGAIVLPKMESSTGFATRGPSRGNPQVYQAKLDGSWFGGYNPFGLLNIPQQKAFFVTVGNHLPGQPGYNMPWIRTQNNLATFYRHRGLVFVDGKPLTQVDTFGELFDPVPGRQRHHH